MTVEYREIPGFPNYRVGSDGSVWGRGGCLVTSNGETSWKLVRQRKTADGYLKVELFDHEGKSHGVCIHTCVLTAFVGPCPIGLQCRHFPDQDKTNNRLENLQWATPLENMADIKGVPRGPRLTSRPGKVLDTKPTDRQQEFVEAIRAFINENGYGPSVRDLCKALAIRSPNGVVTQLTALCKKGVVTWDASRARSIRVVGDEPCLTGISDGHLRAECERRGWLVDLPIDAVA